MKRRAHHDRRELRRERAAISGAQTTPPRAMSAANFAANIATSIRIAASSIGIAVSFRSRGHRKIVCVPAVMLYWNFSARVIVYESEPSPNPLVYSYLSRHNAATRGCEHAGDRRGVQQCQDSIVQRSVF